MILKTENLSYCYGKGTPFQKVALSDINISIKEGEFIGIIGHTGSGKSTLVQHFNGLLRPTNGKVFFEGMDIWEKPEKIREVRFKVGLVFQYPEHQLFEESVGKDIAFGPSNMGLSPKEIERRVDEAMDFVGLPHSLRELSPFDLSGGQKRRAAIAGCLAMTPKAVVLDEPAAGLDPRGRTEIMSNIKNYHEKTGATVILVSHSMEEIANICNRIIVLNQGRIAMDGTCEEIFKRSGELVEMGLDVPEITRAFMQLRGRGYALPDNIYTTAMAKDAILRFLDKSREGRI